MQKVTLVKLNGSRQDITKRWHKQNTEKSTEEWISIKKLAHKRVLLFVAIFMFIQGSAFGFALTYLLFVI